MDVNKFTIKMQEYFMAAKNLAKKYQNSQIYTEHMVYSIINDAEGIATIIIEKAGINPQQIKTRLMDDIKHYPKVSGNYSSDIYITNELKNAFDSAFKYMEQLHDQFLSSEHLLLGIIDGKSNTSGILVNYGLTLQRLLQAIAEVRGTSQVDSQNPEAVMNSLKKYTINLNDRARQNKLDPVIGRDDEIRRIITVLSRRTKNNPILIGDAGVGKTAIVEGLAQRIFNGDVPTILKNKDVLSLDLGSLIAGAKYRGEFEERLKSVLKEITNNASKYILFIDELHTLIGAGAAEGAMDASNMLKPALARGELHAIGATTIKEYRKYIEKDSALTRRFQPVFVAEPTVEETITILRGLKEKYEVHHGVRISDSALISACNLSDRYITDRFLPDKAIDLIDEAASRLSIELDSLPLEMDEIHRKIIQLQIQEQSLMKESSIKTKEQLQFLKDQIKELKSEYGQMEKQLNEEKKIIETISKFAKKIEESKQEEEKVTREGNLERAAELRYVIREDFKKEHQRLTKKLEEVQSEQKMLSQVVEAEDIAKIVAQWTNIPVERLMEGERTKLLEMEMRINKRVIGQDHAISAISNAIRRARSGLQDPNRPIGSFLFLGPTGVGKTETAKALAEFLFDTENAMIRVDMSEYMEKHSVARLIGAPPGYVGYDEGGQLTEAVRTHPYSVILFDEIEKAHSDVFNILLQILDDGRLTDGKGRTVDFKNTILILTSNIGSQIIMDRREEDPIETNKLIQKILKNSFRPEFLNRIDEIINFNFLSKELIKSIVSIQIDQLNSHLSSSKLHVSLDDSAKDFLSEKGFDPEFGARPLKRTIQREILDRLALGKLKGEFNEDQIIYISAKNDKELDFVVKKGEIFLQKH